MVSFLQIHSIITLHLVTIMHMKFLLLTSFFCFLGISLHAQCLTIQRAGYHTVQQGETLFSIARLYGVSVAQLKSSNSLDAKGTIKTCQALYIGQSANTPATYTTSTAAVSTENYIHTAPVTYTYSEPVSNSRYVKPYESYGKQLGGDHVVDDGETIENLARLYGYTTERFCQMNGLRIGQQVPSGTKLRATHCPPCP